MNGKSFAAVLAAGIFLFSSITFAQGKTVEQRDEEDFQRYSPVVDSPFSDDVQPPEYEEPAPDDEDVPELDPEYKDAPVYAPEEKPPETSTPAVDEEGLEFLMYNENGVMAFAVVAAHEKYQLRPILARNQIQGRATVAQMSKNLDDIAIINASYFMPNGSLIGVTKIDGEIVGADEYYRSAIGIGADGAAIFGRVRYQGRIIFYGAALNIGNVNWTRGENAVVLYNRYYGATTGTDNSGVEIYVDNNQITRIFHDKGNNPIPKSGYVISAGGSAAEFFKNAQVGDRLIVEQKILSNDANFDALPNVIGAGPRLVMDGKVFVTAVDEQFPNDIKNGRAPRSAVGVTSYGDYILAVVDGRQPHSRGCTLAEWADILLNKFGAFNAINLDGGGSTELIVKDSLVNKPSDGRERMVGSALAILPK